MFRMENTKYPNLNHFCFVCGHVVPKHEEKSRKTFLSLEFKLAYTRYFDEVDSSGEDYTPNTVCSNCYTRLLDWLHRQGRKLNFTKPTLS